jgi:hypothetical protein
MKGWLVAGAALLSWSAVQSLAADFDGSRALICANLNASDCGPGQACVRTRPDDIGAPVFMRIDFENKSIVGPKRTTPIASLDKSGNQLLLQGTELGYAWSVALDTGSGRLAATLVDREGVFVLFGACTPSQ